MLAIVLSLIVFYFCVKKYDLIGRNEYYARNGALAVVTRPTSPDANDTFEINTDIKQIVKNSDDLNNSIVKNNGIYKTSGYLDNTANDLIGEIIGDNIDRGSLDNRGEGQRQSIMNKDSTAFVQKLVCSI